MSQLYRKCLSLLIVSALFLGGGLPCLAEEAAGAAQAAAPGEQTQEVKEQASEATHNQPGEVESAAGAATPAGHDGAQAAPNQAAGPQDQEPGQVWQIGQVTVTGKIVDAATVNAPAVVETITAEGIARINAVDTADVFKYFPGSFLRKLYPGATNSPLVIRGNNTELTARTLVLMDGIRISDFTAAGNSNGPKWEFVAPQEIERVDVIYGPFSAALPGNALSGAALITTHLPTKLEIEADAQYFYQNFHEFKTDEDINGYNGYISFGDKLGNVSFDVWYNRLETDIQPISYVTKAVSAGGAPTGHPVTGWAQDIDPSGAGRFILGSAGVQDLVDNTFKVKLACDPTPDSQIRFVSALFDYSQDYDSPETYLKDADGNPVYSGKVDIGGVSYNLSPTTFTYNKRATQDLLNGLTYTLASPDGWKVTATGSAYYKLKDLNQTSSTAVPVSKSGGPGTVVDSEGGWYTADMQAAHDIQWLGLHTVAAGYHYDRYFTDSETWNASDWLKDIRTTLSVRSQGKTQTNAVYVEDTWQIDGPWSVYLGGRYEWWNGFDGSKSTDTAGGLVTSPLDNKNSDAFSPKFAVAYSPTENWRLRLSLALATRFPTVGELFYGGINSAGVITNANPDLKPERSFAKDFTITRIIGESGEGRLTFWEDDVDDAIYSQTNFYTLVRNFQNVDEVRTRGIEAALNLRRFLIDGLGVFTNVAWIDSKILRNDAVPTSVGKVFPRVPEWRVKCVLDYSPNPFWAMTFATHYASHQFGTLDNSDFGNGYGAIDDSLVFDTKVSYRFLKNALFSLGVDNLTDTSYHVSHPYPRRTFLAELRWAY